MVRARAGMGSKHRGRRGATVPRREKGEYPDVFNRRARQAQLVDRRPNAEAIPARALTRYVGRALALSVTLLLLALAGGEASAQYAAPPPPPPPPPAPEPGPNTQPPPPVSCAPARAPACRRAPRKARRRYRPGRLGRFYLGGGAGYLWPHGDVGKLLKSGVAYGAWFGWRKRWIGVELGYLGSRLNDNSTIIPMGNGGDEPAPTKYVAYYPSQARISHVTADVKLFISLFCRTSIFARVGVNYTHIGYAVQKSRTGLGYQYGGGLDFRIRLSRRPDWILKLRAEVVNVSSAVKTEDEIDRRSYSGLYAMLYVNIGWAPR